ncbi:hypothetical protein [Winogradskya humida]|uniref:Roadblock/LAMTOR2 domain-containing protein n=1 Tax=Winogradskya humida TaxID=113566 RepID=A0ABQ3ZPH2_9ACTN|nr:hypothetical protein [Actinoplanes humidus]GIE20414.1 hypothetical protein Ahu01nite_035160 [Actinoplanes humidus]
MSLDEALRIPGAYAVALITADEPALTWWGRSPTDREAQAASQVGRAAADLVRLSTVNILTDTLDDVLVTSAQAFHVLRLIPTPHGQDRVAHLMLRRAGANLAMARHDFRRLTAAYATEATPAPAVGEPPAVGDALTVVGGPAVGETSAVGSAPAVEVAPAVGSAFAAQVAPAAEETSAVDGATSVEETPASDVSYTETGADAASETPAVETPTVDDGPPGGGADETAAVPEVQMMQDASPDVDADNAVVTGREAAPEPVLPVQPERSAEAEVPAEPELFAGLEALVAQGSSAGSEADHGMPVADVEALPVFSAALEGEPEIFRDAVAEFAAASEPDLASEAGPDLAPKVGPDLASEAGPDLAPEAESDVEPEAGADVAAAVGSEVVPQGGSADGLEGWREVESEGGSEGAGDEWPELEAELSDFDEEPGAVAELEALDVPDFGDETHGSAGHEPGADAGGYEDDLGSGLDEASDPEQDSLVETEKPVLPRRSPGTENLPAAAVTAKASPAAWLDLLGQPYFNDETVLERVLGSLKRL